MCDAQRARLDEREASKIVALQDELEGKVTEHDSSFGRGYDRRVYSQHFDLVEMTASLASQFRERGGASGLSLEARMWWRDHLRREKEERRAEKQRKVLEAKREAALAKLSEEEKQALGLLWEGLDL